MPYCSNCRTYIPDGTDTCPNCGTKDTRYSKPTDPPTPNNQSTQVQPPKKIDLSKIVKAIIKTEDKTDEYDVNDINANKNSAILAYLGILCIIPFIKSRKSKFLLFHCCQGLTNSLFSILYWVIAYYISTLPAMLSSLINLFYIMLIPLFAICTIVGIVNAINGRAKTLPVFGRIDLMKLFYRAH